MAKKDKFGVNLNDVVCELTSVATFHCRDEVKKDLAEWWKAKEDGDKCRTEFWAKHLRNDIRKYRIVRKSYAAIVNSGVMAVLRHFDM